MQAVANLDVQFADRVSCHFRKQQYSADRHLNDHRIEGGVVVDRGHDTWQHIVQAESGRGARREDDFPRRDSHTDSRGPNDLTGGC